LAAQTVWEIVRTLDCAQGSKLRVNRRIGCAKEGKLRNEAINSDQYSYIESVTEGCEIYGGCFGVPEMKPSGRVEFTIQETAGFII